MSDKIRVLIVDDTVIYRKILKDVVSAIDNTEVIGTAPNGDLALRKIEVDKPDLVLLDVEMPVKDGLETLVELKALYPEIGVIMVSGVNERQAAITMEALQKGAIDFVPKPIGNNINTNIESLRSSLTPIISLFQTKKTIAFVKQNVPVSTTARPIERKPIVTIPLAKKVDLVKPTTSTFAPNPKRADVLVIGVSTGGPNALAKVIPEIPADLNVPILIVQHMPPTFTKSLANHLNVKSKIPVFEAEDGQLVEKNKVYIAPGGKHMIIKKDSTNSVIAITDTPPVNSCKPSVDVLFESVPSVYNANVLSVIMTGMGSDGMNGVKYLKNTGCYSITQTEDSCVVYGMPRAVDEAGLTDESVHLDNLSARIYSLIKNGIK
ncbi:MAG TPA: chemotaxis response regulator protein-glutamate methylesterase [Candidatus Cloacimonadota bacterium]|nr:chemotaxis response regulator protein-glutamate methylesterase [Candidatus Cloacimonadota bacterium]HQB41305.1 chemotaxis response regulator protein-glutamate methylesterase [Candidatus Cloacimonadota bacterium]